MTVRPLHMFQKNLENKPYVVNVNEQCGATSIIDLDNV